MRHPSRTMMLPIIMAATTILTVILSPASLAPRIASRLRDAHEDESGEIVQNILWVAGSQRSRSRSSRSSAPSS